MPRTRIHALVVLIILACLAAAPAPAQSSRVVMAHIFTVPADPPGGNIDAVLPAFENWLATSFGGYTRLGAGDGAWKNKKGQVETQGNIVFLITTGRDVSKDIAARLTRDFGEREPYVLVFPAGLFVK
ncbi:hypothetical protein [Solidesulfovibrio sp. C21]|uniref:hypothetical protein n=1 Tax=Solidesulfovibrio sp. C21 TaxID=3398613 RepID=UPI0039FD866C